MILAYRQCLTKIVSCSNVLRKYLNPHSNKIKIRDFTYCSENLLKIKATFIEILKIF